MGERRLWLKSSQRWLAHIDRNDVRHGSERGETGADLRGEVGISDLVGLGQENISFTSSIRPLALVSHLDRTCACGQVRTPRIMESLHDQTPSVERTDRTWMC